MRPVMAKHAWKKRTRARNARRLRTGDWLPQATRRATGIAPWMKPQERAIKPYAGGSPTPLIRGWRRPRPVHVPVPIRYEHSEAAWPRYVFRRAPSPPLTDITEETEPSTSQASTRPQTPRHWWDDIPPPPVEPDREEQELRSFMDRRFARAATQGRSQTYEWSDEHITRVTCGFDPWMEPLKGAVLKERKKLLRPIHGVIRNGRWMEE